MTLVNFSMLIVGLYLQIAHSGSPLRDTVFLSFHWLQGTEISHYHFLFLFDCKTIYTHIYEQPLSNSSPFLRKSDCVHLATDNVELRSKVVCTWMYIMYTFLELFKPAFKRNVCRVRFIMWQEIWREV